MRTQLSVVEQLYSYAAGETTTTMRIPEGESKVVGCLDPSADRPTCPFSEKQNATSRPRGRPYSYSHNPPHTMRENRKPQNQPKRHAVPKTHKLHTQDSAGAVRMLNCPPVVAKLSFFSRTAVLSIIVATSTSST